MSLTSRLILLTVAVFVLTFGAGALLGVHGARRLAEAQLQSRLARTAGAFARSGARLTPEILRQYEPLLDARILVLDGGRRILAHGGPGVPWEALAASADAALGRGRKSGKLAPEGLEPYYFGAGRRIVSPKAAPVTVLALAPEAAVREPTRRILYRYLAVLCVTALLLAIGTYLVGMGVVRRIRRLNRRIDETLREAGADRAAAAPGGGDELRRLSDAFDSLLERLEASRRRLVAQQRLATTGMLASSIAHEVRNPLQAIKLTLQMLREKSSGPDAEGLELVLSEIDRLGLLADELLVLAGKDTRRVEPVDLAGELRDTLRLLRLQFRRREVRPAVRLPDLPPVAMDPSRCRQLLLNLLLNAVEASARGSTVLVDGSIDPDSVAVRIADSGPGFPEEVVTGRAEEFFSTKSSGAGLGLSICRRIVTEAHGRLRLYNTDRGAVAEVTLPRAPESA